MKTSPLPRSRHALALCLAVDVALAHFGCGTDVDLGSRERSFAGAPGDDGRGGSAVSATGSGGRSASGASGSGDEGLPSGAPNEAPSEAPSGGGTGPRTLIAVGGSTSDAGGASGAPDGPAQGLCTTAPRATDASNYTASSQTKLAALSELVPLRVPVATAQLSLDWLPLEHDAYGDAFVASDVTGLDIYELEARLSDLEGSAPLRLDELVQTSFHADTGASTSLDLSQAVDGDGTAFPGIDYEHTWLVALHCAGCEDRLPPYLSVLTTCDRCGDGHVDTTDGEQCDLGASNGKSTLCSATCKAAPQ